MTNRNCAAIPASVPRKPAPPTANAQPPALRGGRYPHAFPVPHTSRHPHACAPTAPHTRASSMGFSIQQKCAPSGNPPPFRAGHHTKQHSRRNCNAIPAGQVAKPLARFRAFFYVYPHTAFCQAGAGTAGFVGALWHTHCASARHLCRGSPRHPRPADPAPAAYPSWRMPFAKPRQSRSWCYHFAL